MGQNKLYHILFFVSIWLMTGVPVSIIAQPGKVVIAKKEFDKKKWEELTEGLDYSVDKIKPAKPRRGKQIEPINNDFLQSLFKLAGIIIFIVFVTVLLYHLLDGGKLFTRRDKKIKAKISPAALQELEDNLPDANVNSLIQQAIKNGEYSLAVRLNYLATIKQLSIHKYIKWKKNKTNRHYQRELRNTVYFGDFRELTGIFERVWYGDKLLTKEEFQPVYRKFQNFISTVR